MIANGKYIAEPKLDGMRCELSNLDQVRLVRENGNDKTNQFPEIMRGLEESLPQDTVLDGEICILQNELRSDFFTLLTRNTTDKLKSKLLAQRIPATFVAFDVKRYKGQNLENQPYYERRRILESILINNTKTVSLMPKFEPRDLLPKVKPMELEGIILKNINATYRNDWFKFKYYFENDFFVVGTTSEKRLISSLVLENSKGESVGNVNYINYPQTEEMKNKVIGMKAVVRYMKTNTAKLRFPVLLELRSK